jgi:hypothetical protein
MPGSTRLRRRSMRPVQHHDRRRCDPRDEDDRDRALARKERPTGFGRGRCRPHAPGAEFRSVRDRGRAGGRDHNRVCRCVLIPPLAQSRLGFGLGFGAPSLYDRRRDFRLPWTGEGDEPCQGAFRTLAPIRATVGAILRRFRGALTKETPRPPCRRAHRQSQRDGRVPRDPRRRRAPSETTRNGNASLG